MRAVVQRVTGATVRIETDGNPRTTGDIDSGLLVYVGVAREDTEKDAAYLADKVANLRVFMDSEERMNLSLLDLGLPALVVSQFTLMADVRKGRRPSWSEAAEAEAARPLYEKFCAFLVDSGVRVEKGEFQAIMRVAYTNEGPVTILLDSRKAF